MSDAQGAPAGRRADDLHGALRRLPDAVEAGLESDGVTHLVWVTWPGLAVRVGVFQAGGETLAMAVCLLSGGLRPTAPAEGPVWLPGEAGARLRAVVDAVAAQGIVLDGAPKYVWFAEAP